LINCPLTATPKIVKAKEAQAELVTPDVLLTPGAGSDRDQATLVAIDELLPGRVHRVDFPYRIAGRKFPDKEPVLLQALVDAATSMAKVPLVLGGRSMGGRMCSIAAARGLTAARALVLICYPLHPPEKPDRLRTEHFPDINIPCLFISGTKDPFGTQDEFLRETAAIAGPVEHVWIDGADHSLRRKDQQIAEIAVDWLSQH
jgi:uncharacterized protein